MSIFRKSHTEVKRLSVITWNVWFDDFKKKERYDEILAICKSMSVDVICLQEVTPCFLKKVKEHGLAEYYDVSDPDLNGATVGSYGVLTMCRRELNASFQWQELPTNMGRKLLTANINMHVGSLSIGNVHLESLDSAPARLEQLKLCNEVLNRTAYSVLCGDFNFDSDRNFRDDGRPLENDILNGVMPLYKDVWLQLHPPASGKTYDTEVNLMLPRKEERMRYDRIMLRGMPIQLTSSFSKVLRSSTHTQEFVPEEISLLGTAPLGFNLPVPGEEENHSSVMGNEQPSLLDAFTTPEKKARPVFPSDHFGLHGVFAFSS